MSHWIRRFAVISIAVFASASAALASSPGLLFGQDQAYSVTMRGNGETVATVRIAITNQSDAAQKSFTFEIPGLKVSEIAGYQQHLTDTCLDYGLGKALPNSSDILTRPCLQSQAPDYRSGGYYSGSSYSKLVIKNDGSGKYHAALPQAADPGQSTALILTYAGTGYATKQLTGAYNFKFQTIKVADRIQNLIVAIDVDAGQYIDDGTAKVGYDMSSAKPMSAMAPSGQAASTAQLDTIASTIGSDGVITKTAKDLAARESFTVKGTYADAVWKLHPWRLLAGLVIGLLLLGIIVWAALRLRRPRQPHPAPTEHNTPAVKSVAHESTSHTPASPLLSLIDATTIIAGFASALALMLVVWGWTAYSAQTYDTDPFTAILTGVLTILACGLIILGPVVWLAMRRRDWRIAAYIIIWQVIWLIAFLTIYHLTIKPASPPEIMPYSSAPGAGASLTK